MAEYYGNICTCRKCNGIVHTIKRGDTLYLLSRYYNVTINDIMRANANVNVYNLQIGDQICIPIRRPAPTPPAQPNRPGQNMNTPQQQQQMPGRPSRPSLIQPRDDDNDMDNEIDDLIEDLLEANDNRNRIQSENIMSNDMGNETMPVNATAMDEHMTDSYDSKEMCCTTMKVKDVLKNEDMTLEELARMLKNM